MLGAILGPLRADTVADLTLLPMSEQRSIGLFKL